MPDADWPHEGRPTTVVTGASSGIGRALALAAPPGPTLLLGRDAAALAGVATARGADAGTLLLDLTRPDAADVVGAALRANGLRCDILVNNAGSGLLGDYVTREAGAITALFDLNLRAPAGFARAALPAMLGRRAGGILNVASVAGFLPGPGMAAYYASKAGLRSLSEALWAETRGTGVTVSCLCPGPVATAFFDRAGAKLPKLFRLMPMADAASVAASGWAGFRAGRRIVLPDALAVAAVVGAGLLPNALLLPLVRRFQRDRTANA